MSNLCVSILGHAVDKVALRDITGEDICITSFIVFYPIEYHNINNIYKYEPKT